MLAYKFISPCSDTMGLSPEVFVLLIQNIFLLKLCNSVSMVKYIYVIASHSRANINSKK
jgi:hypothetical protein